MKKRSEKTQKFLHALPIAGIVLLVLAMAALCAVALSYAIAVKIAWDSLMAFFLLFGVSFLGAGLTIFAVHLLAVYMRKVWYDLWPDAKGASLFVRKDDVGSAVPVAGGDDASDKKQKTILENSKKNTTSVVFRPKYLTFQNVGYGMLMIAVVFVIVSAALGSLNSDSWVEARSDYMTEHGYYAESMPARLEFSPNEAEKIDISVAERKVVVKYDSSATRIVVTYYELYPGEYNLSKQSTGVSRYILSIARTPEPVHDDPIDKMLELCFTPNRIEQQVIITVPAAYKDKIEISGDNIIYSK